MEKLLIKCIKNVLFSLIFLLTSFNASAQLVVVEPGDASINSSLLHLSKLTWKWEDSNGKGNYIVSTQRNGQEITIVLGSTSKELEENETTLVLNAKTLEPIRKSFKDERAVYNVQYGARLRAMRTFTSGKKNNFDEPLNGKKYFDLASLPFVISTLPLRSGYKASLPFVYHDDWTFKPNYTQLKISEVIERQMFKCVSGLRDIWEVKAFAEGKDFIFVIDKATRRVIYYQIPTYSIISTSIKVLGHA